jgi:hypothetical protein
MPIFVGFGRRPNAQPSVDARQALLERFESYPDFARIVGNIPLGSILVPEGKRLPKGWQHFSLAAIQNWITASDDRITHKPGGVELPANYYPDTRNAIGLVHDRSGRPKVYALAGADVDAEGRVILGQIQGYDNDKKGPLHAGIQWDESLVGAWAWAAREFGADVFGIKSSANNIWAEQRANGEIRRNPPEQTPITHEQLMELGRSALRPHYDGLAEALAEDYGFVQGSDQNWYAPVPPVTT